MSSVRPEQNPLVAYRVIDGAAVLVHPKDSKMYWLNPTATRIWEMADGQHDLVMIAAALTEEFDVDYETGLRDAETMVRAFTSKQLFVGS